MQYFWLMSSLLTFHCSTADTCDNSIAFALTRSLSLSLCLSVSDFTVDESQATDERCEYNLKHNPCIIVEVFMRWFIRFILHFSFAAQCRRAHLAARFPPNNTHAQHTNRGTHIYMLYSVQVSIYLFFSPLKFTNVFVRLFFPFAHSLGVWYSRCLHSFNRSLFVYIENGCLPFVTWTKSNSDTM